MVKKSLNKKKAKKKNTNSLIILVFLVFAIAGMVSWYTSKNVVTESIAAEGEIVVYKSSTCRCCAKWVTHLKDAGFKVKVKDSNNMAQVKDRFGVPSYLRSCHTATINDYVIEGHVPAEMIVRLLDEKPTGVVVIAVPGMVIGSPGMEEGNKIDPYDVVTFDSKGSTEVYATIDKTYR